MDVVFDWLPKPIAASLKAQSPEVLALVGGMILVAIVLGFYATMRR